MITSSGGGELRHIFRSPCLDFRRDISAFHGSLSRFLSGISVVHFQLCGVRAIKSNHHASSGAGSVINSGFSYYLSFIKH